MGYNPTVSGVMEMFADRTAGESTKHNRLVTRETDNGNVALIAYGWLKLAEYDESREVVTVFTGHAAINSKTVNEYLNKVINVAQDRGRDTSITGASPEWDTPNGQTQFIGDYISMTSNKSSVELQAQKAVRDSLAHLA